MVYYYTKRAMLARLLANKGPAIYIVHFEQVFCYTSIILFSSHFSVTISKTATINALVLGSAEALFIMLRMSLKRPQGN